MFGVRADGCGAGARVGGLGIWAFRTPPYCRWLSARAWVIDRTTAGRKQRIRNDNILHLRHAVPSCARLTAESHSNWLFMRFGHGKD